MLEQIPPQKIEVHFEKFKVRSNEIDLQRRLTLPALVNYLQEAANNNVMQSGASIYDLHARGVAWVLSRMKLQLFDYPSHGQEITVKTFPSGSEKYFFYRDFRIYDETGRLIGQATSTWPVIDLQKRQMVSVPDFLNAFRIGGDEAPLPVAKGKIFPVTETSHEGRFRVGWYDIDTNLHANNMCYFRWLVEALPGDFLAAHRLVEVDLQFRNESNLGDEIVVRAGSGGAANHFCHQLHSPEGKDYALARSVWEKV
jgi:medium-chain acyl-[acyl-carrier-protein] hydrolase